MRFDWQTLALQVANFAILVWLLHRFLYKPVLRLIDKRRSEVRQSYDAADAAAAQAKEALAKLQAERAAIAGERDAALQAAAAQAEAAARQRVRRAEEEAEALLAGARKTLAAEREQARVEIRRAALDLGADVARRLLAEVPEQLRAEAWLERIEQHLASLPAPELSTLAGDLTVVTSAPLQAETAEAWRARLQHQLGGSASIRFAADPGLVAGAELHFPTAVLRFTWQSVLADIRSGLEANADAA